MDFIEANNLQDNDYLIYSNKRDSNGNIKPISRQQAHHVLNMVAEKLGVEDVGTAYFKKNIWILALQTIWRYSNITRYI